MSCIPTTKDIYSGAYRSGNNKDEHTCNSYIVKSNIGSIEALIMSCIPTTKDIYSGAYRSGNNKDEHTCNSYIVKSNNGSIENRGIHSKQDVYVYGI